MSLAKAQFPGKACAFDAGPGTSAGAAIMAAYCDVFRLKDKEN